MSDELLPCPFCGGEAVADTTELNGNTYHVSCLMDVCPGNIYKPNISYLTEADAIAAWNRRTPTIPADVRATMRAALECYKDVVTDLDSMAYYHDNKAEPLAIYAAIAAALAFLAAQEPTP